MYNELKPVVVKAMGKLQHYVDSLPNIMTAKAQYEAQLKGINEMDTNGEEFPSGIKYAGYPEWKTAIDKRIKSREKAIAKVDEDKALITALNYFNENAED